MNLPHTHGLYAFMSTVTRTDNFFKHVVFISELYYASFRKRKGKRERKREDKKGS